MRLAQVCVPRLAAVEGHAVRVERNAARAQRRLRRQQKNTDASASFAYSATGEGRAWKTAPVAPQRYKMATPLSANAPPAPAHMKRQNAHIAHAKRHRMRSRARTARHLQQRVAHERRLGGAVAALHDAQRRASAFHRNRRSNALPPRLPRNQARRRLHDGTRRPEVVRQADYLRPRVGSPKRSHIANTAATEPVNALVRVSDHRDAS